MLYEVTFQVGGEEQMDQVDAPDAAGAAAAVREQHGRTSEMFELILVHLVEGEAESASTATQGNHEVAADI